jgi:hypothetical protein
MVSLPAVKAAVPTVAVTWLPVATVTGPAHVAAVPTGVPATKPEASDAFAVAAKRSAVAEAIPEPTATVAEPAEVTAVFTLTTTLVTIAPYGSSAAEP